MLPFMATVRERMKEQRAALKAGQSTPPGPPVLVEASTGDEVLVPKQQEKRGRGQRWTTQRVDLDKEGIDRANEERIERMLALQPLIADGAIIYPIEKSTDSKSPHIMIGRAKHSDVTIVDDTVSSVHAQIEQDEDDLLLSDAGSSNGVFVNRRPIQPGERCRLTTGDCVRFGRKVFYYMNGERLLLFLELRLVKMYGSGERRATGNQGEPR
jgi:hypothetical protein